jgi:hypothetical protein
MRFTTQFVMVALFVTAASARAQTSLPSDSAATITSVVTADSFRTTTVDSFRAAPDSSVAPVSLAVSGAPLTGLRAGVHVSESARALQPNAAATRGNLGQSRAMMVVGVAGLLAGAIIGGTPGTLVMVGGAVIGLVGLYDYLQ